jgi:hypothetical protein
MPVELLAPLRSSKKPPVILYDDDAHEYKIDGVSVPSVSAILDSCDPKPAIRWWAMRAGMAATIEVLKRGKVKWPVLIQHVYDEVLKGLPQESPSVIRGKGSRAKLKTLIEATVLNEKLDINNIVDEAADRGTMVHAAIEEIGTHDVLPDISQFDEMYQGYIAAVCRWWLEQEPVFHRQEVIVASRRLAYAGRFDLDCTYPAYGRALTDFKTSKSIYDSHHLQLALYELADYELWQFTPDDLVKFDDRIVVNVQADGQYKMESGNHVSLLTAEAAVMLYHHRRADQQRLSAGERSPAK